MKKPLFWPYQVVSSLSRKLANCAAAIAVAVTIVAEPAFAEQIQCPLPEDAQLWLRDLPIADVIENWPEMLRNGDVWTAFITVQERHATPVQLSLVQACKADR